MAKVLRSICLCLLLASPVAFADTLDFVIDVMYKAGVIDGNVKAAKPLIECLAAGKSVETCSLGAAMQSEFAEDPQVRNVLDIYQEFRQQHWAAVIKKAGVTVGCALIPGGEIKDVLCGELGKIALSIVNGLGGVLGDVGCTIASLWGGCDEDEPPPMDSQDYYALYFLPTYHRALLNMDAEDGSFDKLANSLTSTCQAYYDSFEETAVGPVCFYNQKKYKKTIATLYQALLDEGNSQYNLRIVPELEKMAFAHFGENTNDWVNQQNAQCRVFVSQAIALPNPYARCEYIQKNGLQGSFSAAIQGQILQKCQNEMKAFEVSAPNDMYAVACEPVQKKTHVAMFGAMMKWKSLMNAAEAAGCSNNGRPDSVRCESFNTFFACTKALPKNRTLCESNPARVRELIAEGSWQQLSAASSNAGTAQRCMRAEEKVLCTRPKKQELCKTLMMQYGDIVGAPGLMSHCQLQEDESFTAAKAQTQQVVDILNAQAAADASNDTTAPAQASSEPANSESASSAPQPMPTIQVQRSAIRALATVPVQEPAQAAPESQQRNSEIRPMINVRHRTTFNANTARLIAASANAYGSGPCKITAPDWMRINCDHGFQWDADAVRAQAVIALLGAPLAICPSDPEADGAEAACLEGMAVSAFPSQKQ